MDITEEKDNKIKSLKESLKAAIREQAAAQALVTAKSNTLTLKTKANTQDEADKAVAFTNDTLSKKASASTESAIKIIDIASKQSLAIQKQVAQVIHDAYDAAEKTVQAARQTVDLAELINKTQVSNKLISALLLADAKTAVTDAGKAVTDTIAALTAAMAISVSAVHANESLAQITAQIKNLQGLLKDTATGIDRTLNDIYNKSVQKAADSAKAKAEINSELNLYTEDLTSKNAILVTKTAALNAANTAVGLS